MFMTERGDPRAIFQPTYGCDPETDEVQIELDFKRRVGDVKGGHICVRSASGDRHEFRYSPFENPGQSSSPSSSLILTLVASTPERPCYEIVMVVDRSGAA